jgi:hypothetical protein
LRFFDQAQNGGHFVLRGSKYPFYFLFTVVLCEEILDRYFLEPAVRYLLTGKLSVHPPAVLKRKVVA